MKIRFAVPVVLAGVALAAGVASANPTYWREHGLLLEVSADPRDGADHVRTNPTRATHLELVALQAPVRLRSITVRFADGRTFSQAMDTIHPGERLFLQLPPRAGIIQGVDLEYGRQIVDRTPARLQIVPHEDARYAQPNRYLGDRRYAPSYERAYPAPERPRYRVHVEDAPSYDHARPHSHDRTLRDEWHHAPSAPGYIVEPRRSR